MGILDTFTPEDRVEAKFSQFYELMREATRAEMMMNAIKCDVPHIWIRQMITGKKEDFGPVVLDGDAEEQAIEVTGATERLEENDG